ncbi:NmrA/HSCARG family protein [bacterium]|nr:MAG: NmrA/HSCARG family protein [bacterium]
MLQDKTILVFGATGQQGGSVANALRANGWPVRALVRDTKSEKAVALAEQGIELVQGDFSDTASLQAAIEGVYGVFSVQPSSGQGAYGVTDEQEGQYGKTIADLAVVNGVQHLVYSSTVATGPTKTGMGHFDIKSEIEEYIRGLDITHTIVRPSTFMEILALPGMGLDKGQISFFMHPDQSAQFIAVEDIGKIVAAIFAAPEKYANHTLDISSDAVSGAEIAEKFTRAAGRPINYQRFPDALLETNPFLKALTKVVDEGRLTGNADIPTLRQQIPGLLTMDQWLEGTGKTALLAAIEAGGDEVALR